MICMYTHVTARVMCIYPLYCCDGDVCLHHDLVTMHAPWLSHCKSSWSCMNWKLGSKHLDVMHDIIPHAATKCSTTKWSEGPTLRDERCVKKFSNLLCLTRCGFHVHLEEDGHFYSNMSMYGRLAERNNCHFSNYPSSQTKLLRSLAFAAMLCRCCSRNGACEAVR